MNRMLLVLLLLAGTPQMGGDADVFAQGIYSRNSAASENVEDEGDSAGGGKSCSLFRARGTENPDDGGQASRISPLKDGWGVVIIATIGYGCLVAWRKRE